MVSPVLQSYQMVHQDIHRDRAAQQYHNAYSAVHKHTAVNAQHVPHNIHRETRFCLGACYGNTKFSVVIGYYRNVAAVGFS